MMKDFDFNSELDDILAEFGVSDTDFSVQEQTIAEPEVKVSAEEEDPEDFAPVKPVRKQKPAAPRPEQRTEHPVQKQRQRPSQYDRTERKPERKTLPEKEQRPQKKMTRDEFLDSAEAKAKKTISGFRRFVMAFTGLVFGAASVLILFWMLFHVHPDTSMASSQLTVKQRADVMSQLDAYSNNVKGELLSNLTYIRKQYKIPEGNLVAPKAPRYNYGSTTDPQEVLAVIDQAREYGLLEDQSVIFDPSVDFYYYDNCEIEYYCDETLLVICWKELIDNRIVSCMEVKVADGSQIRRKLAEDTYGSSQYVYATELAEQCNAVAAVNADYYAFRDLGITAYNRRLYRFDENTYNGTYAKYNATDTLFVNGNGDFLTFHKGETTTYEEMEKFISDNNIVFAIAFGPILVEDWTQQWVDWYPIGEVDKEYSRAGIAQYDHLHYLYMTVSCSDNPNEYHPRCKLNEFAEIMAGKNVRLGYCLDGGQTGEVVFNGKPYNHIDFGTERTVSDIIYFASAIPESER